MRNMVETVMGAVVLAVAGVFVFFAYSTANVQSEKGYDLTARFYKVGGLRTGGDVRINGIKVGTVSTLTLDNQTYDAVVRMSIDNAYQLPDDTVAAIGSQGILGGAYVRLEPGKSKNRLSAGGSIGKTKDFRSLEDQVGQIIFLATGGSNGQ